MPRSALRPDHADDHADDNAGDTETARSLVVIGASAGGVEALRDLVSLLPADFPACVLVVLHITPDARSVLPSILDRAGPLPVRHVVDGEPLRGGQVLVAPPDLHVVVLEDAVALTHGPQENGHRPAVDVLFRSAARSWGSSVMSIVLSGSLDDGAAGTVAVRSQGGRAIAQDFDEAMYAGMPSAAVDAADGVEVLGIVDIPAAMVDFALRAGRQRPPEPASTYLVDVETTMADLDADTMHAPERPGHPAGFGCPDCAGSLFLIEEGNLRRFRCRVGHAWSPESLLARQSVAMESALWMALRSLEEKAALNTDLSLRAVERGAKRTAQRFSDSAGEALRAAELVRRLVANLSRGDLDVDGAEVGQG